MATHAMGKGASHVVTHVVLTRDAPDDEEKHLADPSLNVDR